MHLSEACLLTRTSDENQGIISTAIAKAEKNSVPEGQENVSLLDQYSAKSAPTSGQFTFTCESQVPGTRWPHPDSAMSNPPPPGYAANGKQQQPPSLASRITVPKGGVPAHTPDIDRDESSESAASRERQTRQQINRELRKQARDRRLQTEERYRRAPPKDEEYYVCDLCMYEKIFHEPPRYLIQKFEEKVRQERIEEERRRQRLEKARARGRKGKKPFTRNANDDKPAASQNRPGEYDEDEEPLASPASSAVSAGSDVSPLDGGNTNNSASMSVNLLDADTGQTRRIPTDSETLVPLEAKVGDE
jgi:hypothetical protein